ncbi:pilus assembly protein FimV [Neisseriaceae bacterium TC5R-5]|nr:pilus assembly protein FimV [Neisseriaceae bacterium TC5R-5]
MLALSAFASSFILMSAYYALRYLWRRLRYSTPQQRRIDPIGEAEVFLAYGRTREAVRVLQDSLKDDPHNLPAKVTLLRAYSSAKNSKAYCSLARDVHPQVQDQAIWQTIQKNGQQLAPHDPLFKK